jgi:hypothetical protein
MNMNENENENNFESLRRLLVLKRHEIPPPGYFNNFSNSVIQGIRQSRAAGPATVYAKLFAQAPWLERISAVFDTKPVFASGFVGALCLVLFFGVIRSERQDLTVQPLLPGSTASAASLAALSPTALAPAMEERGIVSSTNPVLSLQAVAASPAFGQQSPLAQTVSFPLRGN